MTPSWNPRPRPPGWWLPLVVLLGCGSVTTSQLGTDAAGAGGRGGVGGSAGAAGIGDAGAEQAVSDAGSDVDAQADAGVNSDGGEGDGRLDAPTDQRACGLRPIGGTPFCATCRGTMGETCACGGVTCCCHCGGLPCCDVVTCQS